MREGKKEEKGKRCRFAREEIYGQRPKDKGLARHMAWRVCGIWWAPFSLVFYSSWLWRINETRLGNILYLSERKHSFFGLWNYLPSRRQIADCVCHSFIRASVYFNPSLSCLSF